MDLHQHYIRFLVWLGAEPPDDQNFQTEQTSKLDSVLPELPSLRKAKLYNLLRVSVSLLFFLFLLIGFLLAGEWRTAVIIAGVLAGIILFAISFLFQALVVFSIAIYVFNQGHLLVGSALLLLTLYLLFAATVRDKDIARAYATVRTTSPRAFKLLNDHRSRKNDWSKFLYWYLMLYLVIAGLVTIIYICQGIAVILSLLLNLPCPDSILPTMFCVSR